MLLAGIVLICTCAGGLAGHLRKYSIAVIAGLGILAVVFFSPLGWYLAFDTMKTCVLLNDPLSDRSPFMHTVEPPLAK